VLFDHAAIQGAVPTRATATSPATVLVKSGPLCVVMKVASIFVLRCILKLLKHPRKRMSADGC
jgi:hypothetical protein